MAANVDFSPLQKSFVVARGNPVNCTALKVTPNEVFSDDIHYFLVSVVIKESTSAFLPLARTSLRVGIKDTDSKA